jgi:hypothetical protein
MTMASSSAMTMTSRARFALPWPPPSPPSSPRRGMIEGGEPGPCPRRGRKRDGLGIICGWHPCQGPLSGAQRAAPMRSGGRCTACCLDTLGPAMHSVLPRYARASDAQRATSIRSGWRVHSVLPRFARAGDAQRAASIRSGQRCTACYLDTLGLAGAQRAATIRSGRRCTACCLDTLGPAMPQDKKSSMAGRVCSAQAPAAGWPRGSPCVPRGSLSNDGQSRGSLSFLLNGTEPLVANGGCS